MKVEILLAAKNPVKLTMRLTQINDSEHYSS